MFARKASYSLQPTGVHLDTEKDKKMSKVIRNTESGLFYVEGQGFKGTVATATRFAAVADANGALDCARKFGFGGVAVVENAPAPVDSHIKQNANGKSFAVSFIRAKDLVGGSVAANKRNPSPRRFATAAEAQHHAARFVKIEKHVGFYVTETNDPVNAWVNQVTGKTNPEIGKARTNR